MSNAATLSREIVQPTLVGMGQIVFGHQDDKLTTVLGSCVGIVIYHARLRLAAVAHVVLPSSVNKDGAPGKFADKAVPEMLRILSQHGALTGGLVAKIAGGSRMFGNTTSTLQIGEANAANTIAALGAARIPVVAQHLGGQKGRRITLDCSTGDVRVEIAGSPDVTI